MDGLQIVSNNPSPNYPMSTYILWTMPCRSKTISRLVIS